METTDKREERDDLARYAPWIAAGVVAVVAVPVGLTRGAPAVVLWLAFALLASAVLLFWEALRAALDPTAPGDEPDTDDEGVPMELKARKRASLQALRDIEFERSIGRLSDEDHKALEKKYRDEARSAMKAIDDDIGPWLARADDMLKQVETSSAEVLSAKSSAETTSPPVSVFREGAEGPVACPECKTVNDHDAVFCKKCGARVATETTDAT